jgi:hypothetical protein
MPDMRLASSLKRMTEFVVASAPLARVRGIARRVLGFQQRRTRSMRRKPSVMAIVVDQAVYARRDRSDSEDVTQARRHEGRETGASDPHATPPRSAWLDDK